MTGDHGEFWNDVKRARKEKRTSNREQSLRIIRDAGYDPKVLNVGAHLQMTVRGVRVDFWPGTGRWSEQGRRVNGRGVHNLLKRLIKIRADNRITGPRAKPISIDDPHHITAPIEDIYARLDELASEHERKEEERLQTQVCDLLNDEGW